MTALIKIGGDTLLLEDDDVREYLEQYGAVTLEPVGRGTPILWLGDRDDYRKNRVGFTLYLFRSGGNRNEWVAALCQGSSLLRSDSTPDLPAMVAQYLALKG